MNTRPFEIASNWLCSWKAKPLLIVVGQSASGKTFLAQRLLNGKTVKELSGFGTKVPKELDQMTDESRTRTVADMAGMSYGPKTNAVLIEDAEFCDVAVCKSIVRFVRSAIMPVVCVCGDSRPIDAVLTGLGLMVRTSRPTLKTAAEIIATEEKIGVKEALRLAEHCNCDLRQAKIELGFMIRTGDLPSIAEDSGVDKDAPGIFDAISMLYPSRGLQTALKLANMEDPLLPMMVAENYAKEKGTSTRDMAEASLDVSTGDVYSSLGCQEVGHLFSVAASTCGKKGLSSRAIYPSIISRMASETANRKKMPPGVHYDTINAVERRIVQTLFKGAQAEAVAREMHSMGLTKIDEWDAVRTLARVGAKEQGKVPLQKRDALKKALLMKE